MGDRGGGRESDKVRRRENEKNGEAVFLKREKKRGGGSVEV